jgi:hypothetical protein
VATETESVGLVAEFTVTAVCPDVYPVADAVTVAVPVTGELNVTEHFPVLSLEQLLGLNEPIFEEKEMVTPTLPSYAEAVIADVWAVVIVVGLAETTSEG